jgi:hypothetical protein
MKKLLLVVLVFIIFVSFATTVSARTPPPQIIVRSNEELEKMREMAEKADDDEFQGYLRRTSHSINGLRTRNDVVSFLELLDSIPLPYIPGARFVYFNYYAGSRYNTFDILFRFGDGAWYDFRFWMSRERTIEEFFKDEKLVIYYENQENNIIIYSAPRLFPNERDAYELLIEIEGYFAHFRFGSGERNGRTEYDFYNEIHENMIITSFADSPWFDRIEPVIIEDEPEPLTSADALIILQATVGLSELSDENIARFEIDGSPTTADALRILRLAVGLS